MPATDKGLGEAWGTKPLIIICPEFAKRAVVGSGQAVCVVMGVNNKLTSVVGP